MSLGQISTCDLNSKDIFWNVGESYYSNIIPSLDVFVEAVHKCYVNESNQVVKKVIFKLKPTFFRKMTNDMADQLIICLILKHCTCICSFSEKICFLAI
jgi:hypothetical protein